MSGRKGTVRGMAGALVLLWATGGGWAQTTPLPDGKAAARVNGEVITMAQLEAMVKHVGASALTQPEPLRKQQQQVVLAGLIDEMLFHQFLKQHAPPLDPQELDARMHDLVKQLGEQNKSLADFGREWNQTPQQVRDNVATLLQWDHYARPRVTDEQMETFYRENKDMFDNVRVHAAEIMLHVPAQNGATVRGEAKQRLTQLRERLVKNELDFAEAAKQYSQGPTREQGGDLGEFPHVKIGGVGILPEPLLQTAFSLPPGQISDVLETEDGVHLLKIIERKPGVSSDYNKIKEDVRSMCIDEMKQTTIQSLRQSAKIETFLPQ
jgi:parvulin-like peptidyl-prolyl isomerase